MATLGNDLLNLHVALDGCQIVHLVTKDFLFNMATRKHHIRDLDQAKATLLATEFWTRMITGLSNPRARLAAGKGVMKNRCMAFCLALMSTWLKSTGTWEITTTFRALFLKVVRLRAKNRDFFMTRAAEGQLCTDCVSVGELGVNIRPHWDIEVRLRVSNEIHPMLRSAQENIDSVLRPEEANFAV
jgi:hypothetical protein